MDTYYNASIIRTHTIWFRVKEFLQDYNAQSLVAAAGATLVASLRRGVMSWLI